MDGLSIEYKLGNNAIALNVFCIYPISSTCGMRSRGTIYVAALATTTYVNTLEPACFSVT